MTKTKVNKTIDNAVIWENDSGKLFFIANRNIKEGERIWFVKNRDKTKENNKPDFISFSYKDQLDNDNKKAV